MSLKSAGTRSPTEISMMSPGTMSTALIFCTPSLSDLITLPVSGSYSFRASIASSAFLSCRQILLNYYDTVKMFRFNINEMSYNFQNKEANLDSGKSISPNNPNNTAYIPSAQYYKDMHCPFEKCQDAQMSSVRHCQEGQKHGGAHKAAASCSFASEPRSFKLSFVAELLLAATRQQGHGGEEKQLCSRHNLSPANREGKSNTAATCWKELSQKEYTQSLPC